MLDEILATNTDDGIGTDNMTAILIKFKWINRNERAKAAMTNFHMIKGL